MAHSLDTSIISSGKIWCPYSPTWHFTCNRATLIVERRNNEVQINLSGGNGPFSCAWKLKISENSLNLTNSCLKWKVFFSEKLVKNENSGPLVEIKHSCMYRVKNNCVENWFSATTSPYSQNKSPFPVLYTDQRLCVCVFVLQPATTPRPTQENMVCHLIQTHKPRSCSHTLTHTNRHTHIDRHTMPRGSREHWVGRGEKNKNWTFFILIYIQLRGL